MVNGGLDLRQTPGRMARHTGWDWHNCLENLYGHVA